MVDGNNFVSTVRRHAVGSLKYNAFVMKKRTVSQNCIHCQFLRMGGTVPPLLLYELVAYIVQLYFWVVLSESFSPCYVCRKILET